MNPLRNIVELWRSQEYLREAAAIQERNQKLVAELRKEIETLRIKIS
jgi:hypothetical protein